MCDACTSKEATRLVPEPYRSPDLAVVVLRIPVLLDQKLIDGENPTSRNDGPLLVLALPRRRRHQLLAFEQEVEVLQFLEQRLAGTAQRLAGVAPKLVLLGDGRIRHHLDIRLELPIAPDQVVDVPARSDDHQRRVLGETRHPVVGEPVPHPVARSLGNGLVASLVRVVDDPKVQLHAVDRALDRDVAERETSLGARAVRYPW
jgi:hypothetical protein